MNQIIAEQQTVAGKNAVITAIQNKMGICPYFGTREILDDVMIQKKSWGGREVPENTTKLSAAANVLYMKFADKQGVMPGQSMSYYQEIYEAFLRTPKPVLTTANLFIQILKNLVTMRNAFQEEKQAMVARIRNVAKDLDIVYPISEAYRIKSLESFRMKNEPLLKELQEDVDFSWTNMGGFGAAQMGFIQKNIFEPEIAALIADHPLWKYFGQHVPGFGPMTCAVIISKLQDPRRFADSGKVRGFCGVAVPEGKPMRRVRGEKVSYDPAMKELLCEVFPESFMKTSSRNPEEPYAILFQECRAHQLEKAVNASEEYIKAFFEKRGETVLDIVNLGWENRPAASKDAEAKRVFLGYKVKTDKSAGKAETKADEFVKDNEVILKGGYKHFLNPAHILQRAKREFGTKFISDVYHMWLYLAGENPRVTGNPRIMAVLEKANMS